MRLSFISLWLAFFLTTTSYAFEMREYSEVEFNKEIYDGKLVVLIFKSENCAICDQQAVSIFKLQHILQYKDMKIFAIHFDSTNPIAQKFHVEKTGTIIVMNGQAEAYRSMVALTPDALKAAIDKSLK
jgi:thioredoxin 1